MPIHYDASVAEPTTYAYHKYGSRHPTTRNGMEELYHRRWRESHTHEVGHLIAHRVRIEGHTYGVLHQALATNIHQAESVAPSPVNHVEAR